MSEQESYKVAVISGGLMHERDVSLRSGRRLARALQSGGHETLVLDLDAHLIERLAEFEPDAVWPMIHGSEGEDGSLQDLLLMAGYRVVGTRPEGCRIATAKPVAKAVVAKNGLRTPASVTLPQSLFQRMGAEVILSLVETNFEYPVVVKPTVGGSALGISLVHGSEALRNAMVNAFAYGSEVLVERYIAGRELAVSIIADPQVSGGEAPGFRALPIVEIRSEGGYDFDARYNTGRAIFYAPAPLTEQEVEAATGFALACHRVLELDDYSRIDVILDTEGAPWFIDSNVVPGMTDTSLFPQAAAEDAGFEVVVDGVLRCSLARQ
ncbi:MAG: D-alanine--D-alanine ligase [Varibaculum sp.]|nr:D-alanine--D-alanine ligase [Varibaculum sp.]